MIRKAPVYLQAVATKRKPVTDAEMLEAARVLQARLDAYLNRNLRKGQIAAGLEPLLRYYARDYEPRQQELCDAFLGRLASAAWQLLFRWPNISAKDKRTMLQSIATARREYNADDVWSPDCIRQIDQALAERTPRSKATERRAGGGRPASEVTRASRVLEIIGIGYFGKEQRRGVRGQRLELLNEREDIARWIVTHKPE